MFELDANDSHAEVIKQEPFLATKFGHTLCMLQINHLYIWYYILNWLIWLMFICNTYTSFRFFFLIQVILIIHHYSIIGSMWLLIYIYSIPWQILVRTYVYSASYNEKTLIKSVLQINWFYYVRNRYICVMEWCFVNLSSCAVNTVYLIIEYIMNLVREALYICKSDKAVLIFVIKFFALSSNLPDCYFTLGVFSPHQKWYKIKTPLR